MRKKKKSHLIIMLLVLLGSLGIGYAFLTQELTINGTGKVTANSWNIYFDNLAFNPNNVALSTGDVAATIDDSTDTDITYTVTLQEPGDLYEFTVDVVNDGTIDAMVGTISNKLGGAEISTTNPLPSYLKYTVTYNDGVAIAPNHLLEHGQSETYRVRLEYKADITASELPATAQTLTFSFNVEYIQADETAIAKPLPVPLTTFATDSWETIVATVHSGATYAVGQTKEVELGNGLGTHTLRVANNTTPEECLTNGFSETACGFVLEFADIISTRRMNPYDETGLAGDGNLGGWPASEMRTYLNDTNDSTSIINSLPSIIKNALINTNVVSGYGCLNSEETCTNPDNNGANFTSTDKLYLFSTKEIWGKEETVNAITYDTAENQTRQLDYYQNQAITTSSYTGAIKQHNSSNFNWWLRSASSNYNNGFLHVNYNGNWNIHSASLVYGVSPAFRIG